MTVPVAVVGGGPAGHTVAYLLQRAGVPYVLLEREAEVGAQPRAGAVEYRTVELLRREGIADEVVPFSAQNHECEFRTADDSVVLDYGRWPAGRRTTSTRSTGWYGSCTPRSIPRTSDVDTQSSGCSRQPTA